MGKGLKCGLMELVMKASGNITKRVAKVLSGMCMVINTRVTGSMTKHKELDFTLTRMEQNIRVNGRKINSMGGVSNHGSMEVNMREIMI
jgi:hypothetical protein